VGSFTKISVSRDALVTRDGDEAVPTKGARAGEEPTADTAVTAVAGNRLVHEPSLRDSGGGTCCFVGDQGLTRGGPGKTQGNLSCSC
jgi:hypothetical protein